MPKFEKLRGVDLVITLNVLETMNCFILETLGYNTEGVPAIYKNLLLPKIENFQDLNVLHKKKLKKYI